MLRQAAKIVGIVFLVLGIAGFIPGLTNDSQLFGIFRVDGMHNLVHIASGLAFLYGSRKTAWSRLTFQVMAVVYGLVTIIGFMLGVDGHVLGLFHVDTADNWLHLLLTAAFVYYGFVYKTERREAAAV